jgi:hypothetical protein
MTVNFKIPQVKISRVFQMRGKKARISRKGMRRDHVRTKKIQSSTKINPGDSNARKLVTANSVNHRRTLVWAIYFNIAIFSLSPFARQLILASSLSLTFIHSPAINLNIFLLSASHIESLLSLFITHSCERKCAKKMLCERQVPSLQSVLFSCDYTRLYSESFA